MGQTYRPSSLKAFRTASLFRRRRLSNGWAWINNQLVDKTPFDQFCVLSVRFYSVTVSFECTMAFENPLVSG